MTNCEKELTNAGWHITGVMGSRLPGETTWHVTVMAARASVPAGGKPAVDSPSNYTDVDQSDDERG